VALRPRLAPESLGPLRSQVGLGPAAAQMGLGAAAALAPPAAALAPLSSLVTAIVIGDLGRARRSRTRLALAGTLAVRHTLLYERGLLAATPSGERQTLGASWRSGYAEDCKSLYGGSIPSEASTPLALSDTSPAALSTRHLIDGASAARLDHGAALPRPQPAIVPRAIGAIHSTMDGDRQIASLHVRNRIVI
jgi:hypothetical protein